MSKNRLAGSVGTSGAASMVGLTIVGKAGVAGTGKPMSVDNSKIVGKDGLAGRVCVGDAAGM